MYGWRPCLARVVSYVALCGGGGVRSLLGRGIKKMPVSW